MLTCPQPVTAVMRLVVLGCGEGSGGCCIVFVGCCGGGGERAKNRFGGNGAQIEALWRTATRGSKASFTDSDNNTDFLFFTFWLKSPVRRLQNLFSECRSYDTKCVY